MAATLQAGRAYRLAADLSVTRWCGCSTVLRTGEIVRVIEQPSPNRVVVQQSAGGLHKVRASTFRMVVDEVGA